MGVELLLLDHLGADQSLEAVLDVRGTLVDPLGIPWKWVNRSLGRERAFVVFEADGDRGPSQLLLEDVELIQEEDHGRLLPETPIVGRPFEQSHTVLQLVLKPRPSPRLPTQGHLIFLPPLHFLVQIDRRPLDDLVAVVYPKRMPFSRKL